MKNLFKLFVPMAAAVIATTACQQEAIAPQQAHVLNITVKASPDEAKTEAPASKTYIEGTKILWGPGEYMLIGVNDGTATVFGTSKDDYADDFEGEDQAWFAFSITPATASGEYTYYGLYPAAAAISSDTPTEYKANLPAQQSASASSYDPKAYILVARPESGKTEAEAEDWVAYFRRATALNKITLSNLPEDIKRVTITAPEGAKMAGRRKFDLTTGASGEIYYGETNTIEVSYSTKLNHESSMDIWFTSWETEVKVGENLTVSAVSDNHIYTRTITPTAKSIQFKEGYLNTLSINMASAVVEDNKELAAGNYVIVAKNGNPASYYAVKAAANGTRIASQDYTGSIDSYEGEGSIVWTVAQESGSYTIANSGKYIGYKGSSNEAYWLEPAEDWTATNYLVDIVWDKTNSCYHVALHNNSNRVFQRNSGSNYFAFYTSNQQKDLLFIPATVDERTPVTLSFAETEVNLTTAEVAGFTGQEITIDPSEATATVSSKLSWKLEDASGIVTSLESGVVTLSGNTGSATVSASFAGDETYMPAAEVSYTINVTSGVTPVSGWIETELSSISAGDVFVMVGTNSSSATYAMANDGGTSSDPGLVAVTVSSGKLTGEIAERIKWNLSGNATDGYTFYPNGQSTRLYCNTTAASSSNSNLRVGDGGSRILFVLNEENRLVTKDDYVARYIGFNGTNNFRGYINTTGLATFKFYKLVDSREEPGMSWSAASATASFATDNILSFTAPTLVNPNSVTGITYASTEETIATINASGEVTITALDGNTVNTGSTTIKAIFEGDATYSAQTVSYTLTVEDNRAQVATPTFSPAEGEVAAGTTVSFNCETEGVTFYYTLNNTTPTTESDSANSVTITEGKTVKVIATKTGYKPSEVASATYTVSGETPNDGLTPETAFTASEAKALALDGNTNEYYIKGIVTKIQNQFSSGYGTANFWIDENGTAQDVFEGYKIKYLGNVAWVDGNAQIALNDEVIIKGKLTLYNSTIAETSEGYLVSVNGITKALTVPTLTATPDDDNKQITVTWGASEGTDSAKSYAVTCGTQNYNASAAGSHTFTMADYGKYDITVVVSADDALSATASTSATLTDPGASTSDPVNGDILFSTDFGTAAVALASYTGGTSFNDASTISYTASNASYVRIDTGTAGNMTAANLFIGGKSGGAGLTATIAGIKSYGATSVKVTWAANNNYSKVSITESSSDAVTSANSASNEATFALSGTEETITVVITGTNKSNTRVDNVSVIFN